MNLPNALIWNVRDQLQSLHAPSQAKSVTQLISNVCFPEHRPIYWIDLGCGTGLIAENAIRGLTAIGRSDIRYYGIDIDSQALKFCEDRIRTKVSLLELRKQSVFDSDFSEFLDKDLVFTCFSNTFLSFGTRASLLDLLTKMSRSCTNRRRRHAIIGITPWDSVREKYHNRFLEWIKVPALSRSFAIRNDLKFTDSRVLQTLYFQTNDESVHKVEHFFEMLSESAVEELFKQSGWKIMGWYHPFTGKSVSLAEEIPEFYVHCETL